MSEQLRLVKKRTPGATPVVTLISYPKDPDALTLVATAARLCRKPDSIRRIMEDPISLGEKERLFKAVMEAGHWSCLRHAVFVFGIEGVSRSYSHQHVRHGVGTAYEQQSQHFICEEKGAPLPHVALNHMDKVRAAMEEEGAPPESAEMFIEERYGALMELAKEVYDDLVATGLPHHEARQVLPNGAETRLIWTANLEAVLNFVTKRACRVNTAEITEVAVQTRNLVRGRVPQLEQYLGPTCYTRGLCYEGARRFVKECGRPWGGPTVLWTPTFPKEQVIVSAKGWWQVGDWGGISIGSKEDPMPHESLGDRGKK